MFIESDRRRRHPVHLLAEYVQTPTGKHRRTVADLSNLPGHVLADLRVLLKGGLAIATERRRLRIHDRRAHGGVLAALATVRHSDLAWEMSPRRSGLQWNRVLAMVLWRLLHPDGARSVAEELGPGGQSTLGPLLGLAPLSSEAELREALEWLLERQQTLRQRTAHRHLHDGCLLLYDIPAVAARGGNGAWAGNGHWHDAQHGQPVPTNYGLMCTADGHPLAIESLPDDETATESKALTKNLRAWCNGFGKRKVVLVGDRGWMPQLLGDRKSAPRGLGWISTVGTPTVAQLVEQGLELPEPFADNDVVPASSPECPKERLLVFRSSGLAAKQRAAQRLCELIESCVDDQLDVDRERLSERVQQVHQQLQMDEAFEPLFDSMTGAGRVPSDTAQPPAHEGLFVVRTNLPDTELDDMSVVVAYRRVTEVERAFRGWHDDHQIWPLLESREDRDRAHLLLCMLAYRVELDMRRALAPMLAGDEAVPYGSSPAAADEGTPPTKAADGREAGSGEPPRGFRETLAALDRVTIGRIYPSEPRPDVKLAATDSLENGVSHAFNLLDCNPYRKAVLDDIFSWFDDAGEQDGAVPYADDR